jgi:hypothetical protein
MQRRLVLEPLDQRSPRDADSFRNIGEGEGRWTFLKKDA